MSRLAAKRAFGRTRRGWVVHQILRSIFSGQFVGGDRLVEEEVAATLGVSRTPVREAFGGLAGIGMIAITPNHGAIVRPFGPAQLREIYQIRWLLEAEAARLATDRIDRKALSEIRERTQRFIRAPRDQHWSAKVVELDLEFHGLLARSCGCARLAEEIGRYRDLIQTIQQTVGNNASAQEVALADHTLIMDAMLQGDATAAAALMNAHIHHGTDAAIAALFGDGADAISVKTFAVSRERISKKVKFNSPKPG
jgi:DNA-binding GntR family transcriptional regulator